MRFYYIGQPGDMFGWGICNTYLARELSKLCDLVICNNENRKDYESPCFIPIADHALKPMRKVRSPFNIGYTFFESPLLPEAKYNAYRHYKHIFAGSTWCENKLRAIGVSHVSTLVQGVDLERFFPQPIPKRNGFRVFSGGKLEYRKGQDIVIATMRNFIKLHPDAVLVTQWHNPWPQTMITIRRSNFVKWGQRGETLLEGLPKEKVVVPPPLPNEKMNDVYAQCDVGLFPNRCEGGTNLVLMEFMAAGRPVIATDATGHRDILTGPGPLKLTQGSYDYGGWFHVDVADCLVQLEKLYWQRDQIESRGRQCRELIQQWTWERAAKTILDVLKNQGPVTSRPLSTTTTD